MVREGIIRILFLYWPQQYHPVHCRPALRNLHALADGPVVEHFECLVQLQHRSTVSWTRLLDGKITVEPITNHPYEFLPSSFALPITWPTSRYWTHRQPYISRT